MVSSMKKKQSSSFQWKKNRFFIPQMFNSRIKKKMQKEGIGVIAAGKDLRGEPGCCLGHCNSVFHLLQVNQKLIKYLLSRVWRPDRTHPHCSAGRLCTCGRHCPSLCRSFEHRYLQPSHKGKIKKSNWQAASASSM